MITHRGTKMIETERLILRRIELNDAEDMFNNWANDSQVSKYMTWAPHGNINVTRELIKSWVDNYNYDNVYHWVIQIKSSELIGSISIVNFSNKDNNAEVGYGIARKFWGNGYTSEALTAVIHYMIFDIGLNRIEAKHAVENINSGKVMEKSGMKFEGIGRQKYNSYLGVHDSKMYGIIKRDLFQVSVFRWFIETPKLSDGEIELICKEKQNAIPEKKYVPAYIFDIVKDGMTIGEISLRAGFTDGLYYGGQIGFNINEEYRGHSYSAKACELLKPLLKAHGMKNVVITNNKTNIASKRTCEKIGAKLIRVAELPEWSELYELGQRFENIYQWSVK